MKFFNKATISTVLVAILSGCMSPSLPATQKSVFIVMKTPVLRYADQGFVSRGADQVAVEIYANGVAVMKLKIMKAQICNGSGLFSCLSKKEFNTRFLSMHYPDDIMENIFRGKKVFGGVGVQANSGGFTQTIKKTGEYAIHYSVLNGSIVFRDTLSNILIKVKENR